MKDILKHGPADALNASLTASVNVLTAAIRKAVGIWLLKYLNEVPKQR